MKSRRLGAAARVTLAAALCLAPAGQAAAQARFEPAFTSYGTAQGMFNARVNALLQDEAGFLWIGTHDGLLRFDGQSFRAYRARLQDPGTLADDYIVGLAAADSGRIWVGAEEGGLQLFDPLTGDVRHFPLTELGDWRRDADGNTEERRGRRVRNIASFGTGVLLLRTDVGLVRFEPATGSGVNVLPAWDGARPLPHATALSPTPDGRFLAAVSDGSFVLIDKSGRLAPLPQSLSDSVSALEPVDEGYLAATFDGGITLLSSDLSSQRKIVPAATEERRVIKDLLALPYGRIWLATPRGAYVADRATGSLHRVGDGDGERALPDQQVSDLLLDRTGVLWLGTWNGLASLHPLSGGITRLYSGPDLEGAGVISIADAAGGKKWIGGFGGGVQLLDRRGASPTVLRPPSLDPLASSEIYAFSGDAEGGLWIAAYTDGVWLLESPGAARRVPALGPSGNPVRAVYSVFRDHAGDVWAGTYKSGLVRYDRTSGTFRPYRGADPDAWDLGSAWVWPIAEDSKGRLWVGAYNGGLSVISKDRATATLHRGGPGSLSDNRVLAVFVDSRDRVWVGTEGGGLNRFDPATGEFRTWTVEDGLPHDNVESIVEDPAGLMWIGTGDGLARFDPANGEFLVFREPAGVAGNGFLANAAHRGSDGLLYFGGKAGLTIVDPEAIAASRNVPRAALTAFRIQGREVPLARAVRTDELVLEPDENFFAFEFAAMDFADVSQNRYRYMLEGLDPDWVDAGNTPVANYTSIPPDRYVFRVAARNSEGVWNDDALTLPIRVLAPFYEQWWFRSLVVVGVLSLVAGFYTYRLRQLEARQRLRLEIAGKLHDDIGANLSNIALKADMVRTSSSLDDRRTAILGDVGRLARDTAHKVRETVWVVNTRYDTLPRLVGHMHDTADTLLAGHVAYTFGEPTSCPDLPLSMEFRQNVYLLFKEAINNAVKHARATRVDITVSVDQRTMTFRVADDGAGFDADAIRQGNGQQLMRTRAADARGELAVTSAPGEGTTVEFSARVR